MNEGYQPDPDPIYGKTGVPDEVEKRDEKQSGAIEKLGGEITENQGQVKETLDSMKGSVEKEAENEHSLFNKRTNLYESLQEMLRKADAASPEIVQSLAHADLEYLRAVRAEFRQKLNAKLVQARILLLASSTASRDEKRIAFTHWRALLRVKQLHAEELMQKLLQFL